MTNREKNDQNYEENSESEDIETYSNKKSKKSLASINSDKKLKKKELGKYNTDNSSDRSSENKYTLSQPKLKYNKKPSNQYVEYQPIDEDEIENIREISINEKHAVHPRERRNTAKTLEKYQKNPSRKLKSPKNTSNGVLEQHSSEVYESGDTYEESEEVYEETSSCDTSPDKVRNIEKTPRKIRVKKNGNKPHIRSETEINRYNNNSIVKPKKRTEEDDKNLISSPNLYVSSYYNGTNSSKKFLQLVHDRQNHIMSSKEDLILSEKPHNTRDTRMSNFNKEINELVYYKTKGR